MGHGTNLRSSDVRGRQLSVYGGSSAIPQKRRISKLTIATEIHLSGNGVYQELRITSGLPVIQAQSGVTKLAALMVPAGASLA